MRCRTKASAAYWLALVTHFGRAGSATSSGRAARVELSPPVWGGRCDATGDLTRSRALPAQAAASRPPRFSAGSAARLREISSEANLRSRPRRGRCRQYTLPRKRREPPLCPLANGSAHLRPPVSEARKFAPTLNDGPMRRRELRLAPQARAWCQPLPVVKARSPSPPGPVPARAPVSKRAPTPPGRLLSAPVARTRVGMYRVWPRRWQRRGPETADPVANTDGRVGWQGRTVPGAGGREARRTDTPAKRKNGSSLTPRRFELDCRSPAGLRPRGTPPSTATPTKARKNLR